MHGLIFAALRDYSIERLGDEPAAELWADRLFETARAYEDEWFAAQLERLVRATGETRADVFEVLLGIEERIHELVRATIAGAQPPRLHVHALQDQGVLVSYTSERRLCSVLEGLVLGTAAELGDAVDVEQVKCMYRGDPACVFTVLRSEG